MGLLLRLSTQISHICDPLLVRTCGMLYGRTYSTLPHIILSHCIFRSLLRGIFCLDYDSPLQCRFAVCMHLSSQLGRVPTAKYLSVNEAVEHYTLWGNHVPEPRCDSSSAIF